MIGAIEAGGTKFVLALAGEDGEIVARHRLPTTTPGETLGETVRWFSETENRHGRIGAFGVASFGPIAVDPGATDYGTIGATPKPGWQGMRYQDALAPFKVPISVDSDVNGAALGEWQRGAGQGCDVLAYTTVGTGIGTGVLRQGRAMSGIRNYEAGHIPIAQAMEDATFAGICPFHGNCLEGLASGPAIAARWGQGLDMAAQADPGAIGLIAGYLADLATAIVLLHMPDRLIFGGGVMKTPGLIEALRRKTERKLGGYVSHPRLDPGLERYIVAPGLGDDAGIVGAIALAMMSNNAQ